MKKVINSLFVIIAAMIAVAGCAKHEVDTPEVTETKLVHFFAESIETKTHFDDKNDEGKYPTLWDANDRVKVFLNLESPTGIKGLETIADVEVSEDSKSARFNAEINSEYAFDSYTFYAVSPATAYNAKSSKEGRFTVQIRYDQTPQPASVDKAVQVLYSISATTDEFQSSVQMHFKHFTAYGKLSLINLTNKISEISSVKLSFPENVVGKWNYFVADGTIEAKEATKEIELTTASTDEIWFACAPVDVSGKTITLTVTTDKGDLVKEIKFPENRRFEAGKISKFTVDMSGIEAGGTDEPEQPGETEWVATQFADLKAGDQVVIVSTKGSDAYAMTNDKGTGAAPATLAVTYANNKLSTNPGDNIIWTVTVDGDNRIFHPNGDTSNWLYCTSSNNGVRVGTNVNKTFKLDSESGYMVHVGTSRYIGVYNAQDWRCYTSINDNIKNQIFQFFVNAGSGSDEPEQPKTLVSIAVSDDAKKEYTVGEDFVKPTVTATYGDGSTKDVTASSTFSGYDMETIGEYEVLVSYTENEVAKSISYTIKVNEAAVPAEPIVATIQEFLDAEVNENILYQLTGTITNIANTTYGNFTIEDATASVYIYGLTTEQKTSNDKSFASLGLKVGDEVTLVTVRGVHGETPQGGGQNTPAYYISHVAAPYIKVSQDVFNVGNDATSVTFTVEANVGWGIEESEEVNTVIIDESEDGLVMTVKADFPSNETNEEKTYVITFIPEGLDYVRTVTINQAAASHGGEDSSETITVSNTIANIADANGWVNSTKYDTINLDDVITATVSGGGNTGKYYTSGENWRIYQTENPTLVISAGDGYTIKTVKITYSVDKTGVLTYNKSNITSGTVVDVNAASITFGVGNTGSETKGQVRVTAIEVVYKKN